MNDSQIENIVEKLNSGTYLDFLCIGEEFETACDMEHAIIFYKYAKQRCDSSEEKLNIANYILKLSRDPATDRKILHEKFKLILLQLIRDDKYAEAYKFICGVAHNNDDCLPTHSYFLDNDLVILYLFIAISSDEQSLGIQPILTHLSQMSDICRTYYCLKFLIRRIQFSLAPALQLDLIDYLSCKQISLCAVHCLAKFMNIQGKELDDLIGSIQALSKAPVTPQDALIKPCGPVDYEHTFSFIICVNDNMLYSEAALYIQNLSIPDGYGIEIIPVYGATSMASGYNKAMRQASGKYKVYLHQDIFLINKNLICDALRIFDMDSSIGMIGIAGSDVIPICGSWWNAHHDNIFYCILVDEIVTRFVYHTGANEGDYITAKILDGVLLITSVDLPWREDLADGWHFYDVTQSLEFNSRGYKTVIPVSPNSWALHEQPCFKTIGEDYIIARNKACAAYPDLFVERAYLESVEILPIDS